LALGQLVHSVVLGPEQVAHEASHAEQPVSLVAVQAAVSNCPAGQVGVHDVHDVLPVELAKVPAVQPTQVVPPMPGWEVPAGQAGQLLAPVPGCADPAGQLRQVELPANG
jgi:hypothetical protein